MDDAGPGREARGLGHGWEWPWGEGWAQGGEGEGETPDAGDLGRGRVQSVRDA